MKDITVIIPVHKFDSTIEGYLNNAIKSAPVEGIITVVCAEDIYDELAKVKDIDTIVRVKGETDFCSMVNKGAEACKTEYFTILEYDDVFRENAFKSFIPYVETNEPDTKVFLSIQELYDASKGNSEAVGYINETAWASAFSEEIGFLDIESLSAYYNFNVTGAFINTEFFKKVGGLKPSIKISFWYEYLLRTLYNKGKVYVVPKVCYKHTVNREDSLMDEYTKTISQEEGAWWIELAQEEYFFTEDRKRTYNK